MLTNGDLHGKFDEFADDDEVIQKFFKRIDVNNDEKVSADDIRSALEGLKDNTTVVQGLEVLLEELKGHVENDQFFDMVSFRAMARKLPRIHGQRVQWAKSLGLERALARHLKVGDLFDELSGIKSMTDEEIEIALGSFLKDAATILRSALSTLRNAGSMSEQAKSLMSKFSGGFTGRFGDTSMFEKGLESEIGQPDPMILKGIFRDNVSKKKFKTPNYGVVTSDFFEYGRLFGNPGEYQRDKHTKLDDKVIKENENIPIFLLEVARGLHNNVRGPTESELKELVPEFRQFQAYYKKIAESAAGIFPGDIGDAQYSVSFVSSNLEIANEIFSAAKAFVDSNDPDSLIFLDPLSQFDIGPGTVDITAHADSVIKLALNLKDKLVSTFGSTSIKKDSEQMVEFCEYCNEEALEKSLEALDLRDLRRRSRQSAAGKDDCIRKVLSSFRDETERLRKAGKVRVQGRVKRTLREIMSIDEVMKAGLRVEEAVQVYVYTGPSYQVP
jgi:hypothetical protein